MAIFNRNSLPLPLSECAFRAGGDGDCCLVFPGWIPLGYRQDTILDTVVKFCFLIKTKELFVSGYSGYYYYKLIRA